MIIRVCLFILLNFTLSACGVKYSEIETPPLKITPNSLADAQGLDIYAVAREKDEESVPKFRGTALLEVRTNYKPKTENKTKEYIGANCVLDGQQYTAEFITPRDLSKTLTFSYFG